MNPLRALSVALPWLLAVLPLHAETTAAPAPTPTAVYECGTGNYSAQPCAGGQRVQTQDPRTPAQRQDAAQAAKRDAQLAQDLVRDRQRAEQAGLRPAASLVIPTEPTAAGSSASHGKRAKHAGKHKHGAAKKAAHKKSSKKAKGKPASSVTP